MQPPVLECEAADLVQLSREILHGDRCLRFRATGNSMQPAIRHQEIVWVRSWNRSRPSLGEVVFFQTESGSALAHRVVKIERTEGGLQLHTRGDACLSPDRPIPADQVLGQVIMVEREGRLVRLDTWPQKWAGLVMSTGRLAWLRLRGRASRIKRWLWPR